MIHLNKLFLIISLLILISCKKDNNEIEVCKAGLINENMYHIDFIPDSLASNISIDLNRDGKFDINMRISIITSQAGHEYVSGIEILDSTCQIIYTPDHLSTQFLNLNDTIDKNQSWSFLHGFIWFVRDADTWTVNFKYQYNYWLNKTGFIGIRKEYSKGLYKYGWIKISVDSYTKVIVYEYGFMK